MTDLPEARAAVAQLAFVEDASPKIVSRDSKEAIAQIDARLNDVLAGLQWFVANHQADEALRMANGLYRFWITTRRFEEGARWFDAVLALDVAPSELLGRAYYLGGFMPFWMGDDARADTLFGRAVDVARQVKSAPLISQALTGLARVAFRTNVDEGRRLSREALAVSEAAGDEPGTSNALHVLGVGAQMAGDLAEARQWMIRRLAMVRASGNPMLIASEAANLSMVERQLGDLDRAEELAREALQIGEAAGDEFTKPFTMAGLAAIAMERRQLERSATLLGVSEALMEAHKMEWPPDERPHYERMLAELPPAMGIAAFETARAAGRLLSNAQAVVLALRP